MAHSKIQFVHTPGGTLSMMLPVAQTLLQNGVISGTLDGGLHAADAATVKAALITHAICDFCSAPGAVEAFNVPDFAMSEALDIPSTGGWAACETCAALVRADKRETLLQRAVEGMAFSKWTKEALKDLHRRFWRAMDVFTKVKRTATEVGNLVEDRLPEFHEKGWGTRERRVRSMMKLFSMTEAEIEAVVRGDLTADLVTKIGQWGEKYGASPRTLLSLLHRAHSSKPPLPDVTPHWQQALNRRFEALRMLQTLLARADRSTIFNEPVDLKDPAAMQAAVHAAMTLKERNEAGFTEDIKFLRAAETYSFNAETTAAIREAATRLPGHAPLSSIQTPTGAGWFWFGEPLALVGGSPLISDHIHGLLWGWTAMPPTKHVRMTLPEGIFEQANFPQLETLRALSRASAGRLLTQAEGQEIVRILREMKLPDGTITQCLEMVEEPGAPALMFSAYVVDEKSDRFGALSPSTRWYWPFHQTFEEMLAAADAGWEANYGEGSDMEHWTGPELSGKDATLTAIRELSRFFMRACVWFKQTVPADPKKAKKLKPPVLTTEPGHVERHARKQFKRDFNLPEIPTVQVVALRKTERAEASEAPAERTAGAREYHCRWIVHGHDHLYRVGPGRKELHLRWIDDYPKGPDDKPLRIKERVYAVIR